MTDKTLQKRSRPVVALDGPAGAGKSTIAKRVADELGYTLVDTGALYRGVALAALEAGLELRDGVALSTLMAGLSLAFDRKDGSQRLLLQGVDREADIRTLECGDAASIVSQVPEVRAALLGVQRALGVDGGVVLEGRDIGTVVFPDAEVKIFLTADETARAQRRQNEISERGNEAELSEVLRGIQERDRRDSLRQVAPLRAAEDAVVVDTTHLTLEQATELVLQQVRAVVSRQAL